MIAASFVEPKLEHIVPAGGDRPGGPGGQGLDLCAHARSSQGLPGTCGEQLGYQSDQEYLGAALPSVEAKLGSKLESRVDRYCDVKRSDA